MTSLCKQIKNLFEQELYSNVIPLASMVVTISDNDFKEYVTPQETFQVYCYYGDSLFHLQQYRKAETMYRRALQLKKSLTKPRGPGKPSDTGSNKEWQPDADIKYKLHLCYVHMNQIQSSIEILQSIPAKQRSPKVNMCLGQAYERAGVARPAAAAYREALRACPLALEAAERLLALAVRPAEVLALMAEGVTGTEGGALITAWMNARAQAHARDWSAATRALRLLDAQGAPLRGCPVLLTSLGELHYYSGDYKNAISYFQRAHAAEPHMQRGLGAYAASLALEGRLREKADQLLPAGLPYSEYGCEEWMVLGHIHADRRRLPRAAYFAQKACMMDSRSAEALLLKGNILLTMNKHPEALVHFSEALQVAPGRYEAYGGLAEVHLALGRPRDAVAVAASACKQLGNCPRALTLHATMLMKEGGSFANRARDLLECALAQNERHLPAALALARLLDTIEDPHASIDLLEKQVAVCPSAALHQVLGEAWARLGGPGGAERALQHYGAALALEPGSRRALDALARLDRTPPNPPPGTPAAQPAGVEEAEPTFELVAEGNIASDNSNGPEESETEAVWSDTDLEVPRF